MCHISVIQRDVTKHLLRRTSHFCLRRVRHDVSHVLVDVPPHRRHQMVRRPRSRAHQRIEKRKWQPPQRMKCHPVKEELQHWLAMERAPFVLSLSKPSFCVSAAEGSLGQPSLTPPDSTPPPDALSAPRPSASAACSSASSAG